MDSVPVKVELVETLDSIQGILNRAKKAVEVRAPDLARRQLKEALRDAQGQLMYADDLSTRHIQELEERLRR